MTSNQAERVDVILRGKIESEIGRTRGIRKRQMKRALKNDRVYRRVRNEFVESLALQSGYRSPDEMFLMLSDDEISDAANDDKFDWDAFMEFMLQLLEVMIKLFL